MTKITIEVCVSSLAGARTAVRAGADRLELCTGLTLGGLTPPPGLVEAVVQTVDVPVIALVRPREGGFRYHADDVEVMRRDVAALRSLGVAGFALGALDASGALDEAALAPSVDAADGADLCLHRAFDAIRDPDRGLERAIALGFDRILTSGGAARAADGIAALRDRVRAAAGRIEVMPGGGVSAENARAILGGTGARALHLSASRWVAESGTEGGALTLGASAAPGGPGAAEPGHLETDGTRIEAVVRAVADHRDSWTEGR